MKTILLNNKPPFIFKLSMCNVHYGVLHKIGLAVLFLPVVRHISRDRTHNELHKLNCHLHTDLDAHCGCKSLDMTRCYHHLPNSRLGESDASK